MNGPTPFSSSGPFPITGSRVSRRGVRLRVEFVYEGLSSLGNVGIVGLYATIMVSLGAMIKNVIPTAWSIVYVTLSDPLPLLQLIDVMEVCRMMNYP